MTKKLAIIFTGGTISMKFDPELHAAIPALNADEIVSTLKNIEDIADVEVINYANLPSPHITPSIMMDVYHLVMEKLADPTIDGVIVTHGTDTMEETAYMLDLLIDSPKPVVVVGAMRNFSELGYDGASNLSAAICTAVSDRSRDKGVLVVMNNEVNAASQVTKTNTLSLDTFKSPEFGALGIVDNDEIIYYRSIVSRQVIGSKKIEEKVALIKAVAGMESDMIDFCIDSGYKGIVIEAMGRGNLPPQMVPGVKRAIEKNIPVVLVSRCNTGRVLYTYGYEGGGKQLRDMGAILGGNLPGQKARIKLMLILGRTTDYQEVKELFELNLY
ncbi:asparaginase [Gudongella sp. DL1XJH-153]|uniref:asparaginase n=1 Tax=Gudongella sp. DL1XJH-153 TaxID=3409804 RepID=UPI003BB4CC6B